MHGSYRLAQRGPRTLHARSARNTVRSDRDRLQGLVDAGERKFADLFHAPSWH